MVEFNKKYKLVIELHNYPSDISREQFEIILHDLENAKKKTKPDENGISLLEKIKKN